VRLPSPAAAALAGLVAAAFVLRPLAHGVPAGTLAAFWATALGQVLVPGVLLVRGARLVSGGGWLLLAQGATLGLAVQGLAVLAGRALSFPWLPTAAALAAASAGLLLGRRDAGPRETELPGAAGLTLAVVLAGVLVQPLESAQHLSAPLPFDLLFHAGNAAELRHRWPLEDPRVAGTPLSYHMLAYALPVEAADLARAPVADPLLALAPQLWVALLAVQAAAAGRVLFGSARAGALGAAVLLLHADPGAFLGLGPGGFNSNLATGIYGSPTTVCGLILLAGFVPALDAWLADARPSRLAALAVLALAASAAKTTVLPVVVAGLALAGGRALVLGRRAELARLALALAAVAVAGVPLTLWQAGWQAGGEQGYTGLVRVGAATAFTTSAFAGAVARAVGASALPPALVPPAFALWLAGYLGLAGTAGALWLAWRPAPLGALRTFSLGVLAAGLSLGLALDVPASSQLFLAYNGQLLLALFAGAFLEAAPGRPWRRAPALVAAALVLPLALASLAQLGRGLGATLGADLAASARVSPALDREYADGLAWLRAHASRDAVVFADNPSLLLSAVGEVRLFHENDTYTARTLRAGPAREQWSERVALQQRLLRRGDAAAVAEARRDVGPAPRLLIAADAVDSRVEAGFVHVRVRPVLPRRFFAPDLFERPYASATLQVYEAREPARQLSGSAGHAR
jgi:hypothetical protein